MVLDRAPRKQVHVDDVYDGVRASEVVKSTTICDVNVFETSIVQEHLVALDYHQVSQVFVFTM